jgi:hypothetical protein
MMLIMVVLLETPQHCFLPLPISSKRHVVNAFSLVRQYSFIVVHFVFFSFLLGKCCFLMLDVGGVLAYQYQYHVHVL